MPLEIEGKHVRVFTGLAMCWRLVQVLGPVRALRVAQAVARMGGPVLGVDWGRRRLLRQSLALAGLALLRRIPGGTHAPRTAGSAGSASPRLGPGEEELWEGFVLLPEGAPIPPFGTCAPAPILCQTDGRPEAEALRGETLPVQDLAEARAQIPFPLYRPTELPFQQGQVIRFRGGGRVFIVMLDFGRASEPEGSLWARPIYPRPYPVWPVRHPEQPEIPVPPAKVFFTPAPGVLLPTVDGYMVHWIEQDVLYTLVTYQDPEGSLMPIITTSLTKF